MQKISSDIKNKSTNSKLLIEKLINYCETKYNNSIPIMTDDDQIIFTEFQTILDMLYDLRNNFQNNS